MINLLTGGALVMAGVAIGLAAYHIAFRTGANTVWRATGEAREPLFGSPESTEFPSDTAESDADALQDEDD